MMEFTFNLPDDWTYVQSVEDDGYRFWKKDDPTHQFSLSNTALEVYGDKPLELMKIIRMQMDSIEALRRHIDPPMGRKVIPPATMRCTTPFYCAWQRKHEPNKSCYCELPNPIDQH